MLISQIPYVSPTQPGGGGVIDRCIIYAKSFPDGQYRFEGPDDTISLTLTLANGCNPTTSSAWPFSKFPVMIFTVMMNNSLVAVLSM